MLETEIFYRTHKSFDIVIFGQLSPKKSNVGKSVQQYEGLFYYAAQKFEYNNLDTLPKIQSERNTNKIILRSFPHPTTDFCPQIYLPSHT